MNTHKIHKKILSILTVFTLILSTLTLSPVSAASWTGNSATSFAGGSGTSTSPYLISTPEQLAYLAQLVNANNTSYNAKYYSLTADIDLGGREWTPIGKGVSTADPSSNSNYSFKGQFNGNGHTVSNFKITKASTSFVGLFGNANGGNNGKISNLYISDFTINATLTTAHNLTAGGLAGSCYNKIVSCGVSNGTINVATTSSSSATIYAGGLVGRNQGGAIQNSFARVNVTATTSGTSCHSYTGGFVGYNTSGNVYYNYATGNAQSITNGTTSAAYAGGFSAGNDGTINYGYANGTAESTSNKSTAIAAGFTGYNTGVISTSYATGSVNTNSVTKSGYGGGFTGNITSEGSTTNCFAIGTVKVSGGTNEYAGGFTGKSDGTITKCYRSSTQSVTGGTKCTLGAASAATNFTNKSFFTSSSYFSPVWDFNTIWTLGVTNGYDYPTLQAVSHPTTWSGFAGGEGTVTSPYEIATAEQLTYLATNVNNGVPFSNTYFKLTANIDLGGNNWTPIGVGLNTTTTATSTKAFCGNFDGGNYTISNFTITTAKSAYSGLFGVVYGGSISNLNVTDFNINVTAPTSSMSAAGGVAGVSTGTISDCYVKGSITGIAKSTTSYVGGLVGRSEAGTITGCIAEVNATGSTTVASCHSIVGGLVGHNAAATITESYSSGNVESYTTGSTSAAYAGGLIGQNSAGTTVNNCYSTALVKATSGSSTAIAGGFIGHNLGNVNTSYSTGTVESISSTKSAYGGGFVGNASGIINSCFTIGNVTLSGGTNNYVGQFAGKSDATLTKCYYADTVTVTPEPQDKYGISSAISNLTKKAFYTNSSYFSPTWNFTSIWQIGAVSGYSYPTLINTYIETTPDAPPEDTDPDIDPEGWDGMPAQDFAGGNGTEASPYQIANAAQLLLFANNVNDGNSDYTGRYYILTDNIDLNARNWTPIGKDEENFFSGHFDGNGYSINNLKIKKTSYSYVGLFGYISNGSLDNIVLNNVKMIFDYELSKSLWVGAVTGYINGTITNCYVNGEMAVTTSGPDHIQVYAGGIAGCIEDGSVTDATSELKLNVQSDEIIAGGVAGTASGTFTRVAAKADVVAIAEKLVKAGGISGVYSSDNNAFDCYSSSNVTAESNVSTVFAGGLTGLNTCNWYTSYACGNVTGKSATENVICGGLFGYSYASINSTFATGNVYAETPSGEGNVGSLVGQLAGGSLNKCYRSAEQDLDGTKVNTRGSSTALANLKSKDFLTSKDYFTYPWDFKNVWTINPASGYEFPVHRVAGESLDVWEGEVATGFDGGSGTSARPYKIANAAQLAYLAYMVNTGTNYANTKFELTADIDLSENTWVPIGKGTNLTITSQPTGEKAFCGEFNGNGFTISNVTIDQTDKSCYGLFGCIYNGEISDLRVDNVKIDITANKPSDIYVGAIAGHSIGSVISSSRSTGYIKVTSPLSGDIYAGGIIGSNDEGILEVSYSTCDVISTSTSAANRATSGGITGRSNYGEINNCYWSGNVVKSITMGNVVAYAGGIAGYTERMGSITNGYANGNITASSYIANSYAGGIAGTIYSTDIESMISVGNVAATSEAGNSYGGGIIGNANENTITKCYKNNQQTVTASTVNSSGTALASSKFTDASFFTDTRFFTTLWNFDSIWEIGKTAGYIYPTLQNVPHSAATGSDTPGDGNNGSYTVTYSEGLITINAENAVNDAIIIISAYKGNVLTNTEFLPADIPQGESMHFPETFSASGADKIKIMLWESMETQSQLTTATEIEL